MKLDCPEHDVLELAPKQNKYAYCIPVLNEGSRIQTQLREMSAIADDIDIVIADGGSTDGSLAEEFLKENKVNTLLTKTGPGKLSAQMRMAMAYCLERGYEGLVFMDGNNKDNCQDVYKFIEKLDEGYDHIQGSRYLKGGHHENTPMARHLAVNLLHAPLISLAARYRYTDTTNGFRAYSRKLLLDSKINVFRDVFSQYELHYYLAIEAARNNYRVIEVPVTRVYPKGAVPSKIQSFSGYSNVLKTLFKACWGTYRV